MYIFLKKKNSKADIILSCLDIRFKIRDRNWKKCKKENNEMEKFKVKKKIFWEFSVRF